MQKETITNIHANAKTWVLEAGELIRKLIREPMTIDTKSDRNDLVTSADQEVEQFFASKVRSFYADHYIIGEEGYGDQIESLDGTVWIIDPIDGTMNFVHQQRYFCISVGIYQDGVGEIGLIYDVMGDVLYSAVRGEGAYKNEQKLPMVNQNLTLEDSILGMNHFWLCQNRRVEAQSMQKLVKTIRGTRTYGSAALEFAYVAEGIVDGYLALGLSGWDIAAGIVIVNEVGGVTTDIDGNQIDLLSNSPIFVANPAIHTSIIEQFIKPGRKNI
ncbi:Inositol-phosphate phosphatase [Lentibacillus sp. JNUCC-1]|uniref:inositol monophosphatase family protein n=1 Tax=Lentibacillus sp. JNUCC-1 TaxID=2654513 RepID=UPI0012E91948|nr:inositol monophosphatase family protein [Lentibacillus sp. JNUCC-1]MUV36263.1 Inositol-phosphate phosphatase [Lentibacillus sp. JNUCC-1]